MARAIYKKCEVLGKIVPIEDCLCNKRTKSVDAKLLFIQDEMKPTKHMKSGKHFTSKKLFRNETKAYGCEEIGDAYDRGYNPEVIAEKESKERLRKSTVESMRRQLFR